MTFNVVIPARYESTRLPGKPLLEIAGVPMVIRTAIRANESGAKVVIIATDDERIMDAAQEYGFDALMTDKEHISGTDRVLDVANQKGWLKDEIIINVQGDEPLIDPELIKLLAMALEKKDVNYVSACSNFENFDEYLNPNNVKVICDKNKYASDFYRDPLVKNKEHWSSEKQFHHIGIYGYTKKLLDNFCILPISKLEKILKLEQLRALENNISLLVLNYEGKIHRGIDTPEDLSVIRKYLEGA
jgi:3-deoxy-manno-octulosonate cytidylyltransferase (CMP-KDO synthetase)|tara:strand:- start:104 stop:838 length:735 start_codon:yes stop_codon:yes gene_type:complete